MKFVASLTAAERLTLLEARDQGPTAAFRRRAQAVELSSRGYRRTAIADLLDVHRETVSGWLNLWDTQGLRGLYDQPRSGRPPCFTPAEAEQVRREVEQSPRQLRQVQVRLQDRLGKTASRQTLRRVLKKVWLALAALPAVAQAPPRGDRVSGRARPLSAVTSGGGPWSGRPVLF